MVSAVQSQLFGSDILSIGELVGLGGADEGYSESDSCVMAAAFAVWL